VRIFSAIRRHIKLVAPAVAIISVLLAGGANLTRDGAEAQTPEGGSEANAELSITRACGPERRFFSRAWETGGSTGSNVFVPVPAMALGIGPVAATNTSCIVVHYNANMRTGNNFCYFEARYNGVPMSPQGGGIRSGISFDTTNESHTLMWLHFPAASAGAVVQIYFRSSVANQVCVVDDQFISISIRG
jgi:hypothetical protein